MPVEAEANFSRTRRRLIAIVTVMVVGYGLSLALLGIAFGFDHGVRRWLLAAAFAALAMGSSASVLIRVVLLVLYPAGREVWWTQQSQVGRATRALFLTIRVGVAGFLWYLAARLVS